MSSTTKIYEEKMNNWGEGLDAEHAQIGQIGRAHV